ncbi:hypothetical protein [Nocardia sp. NPDC052566]|uniref:hypothetical protein n=1 Tax=Nocardia sp. NPDC052566 TaxID=3364330 RepID=UPI0037CC8F2D
MGDTDKPPALIPSWQDLLDPHNPQPAQQKASEAQGRTQRGDQRLTDLGAGTDPDYVQTVEHFEGLTHEAIYAAVHGGGDGRGGMDAAGLKGLRQTWFDTYSDLVNLSTFNLMGLNRIFSSGRWEGAGGDAARAASEQFDHVANQIGQVFSSVTDRLDALAWSAEALKTAIQPPPTPVASVNPDNPAESVLPGLANPTFDEQADNAREQARQAAVRAVNSIYVPTFPPAGTGVPAYTTVPQIPGANAAPDTLTGGRPGDVSTSGADNSDGRQRPDNVGAPANPQATQPKTEPAATNAASTTPANATSDNQSPGAKPAAAPPSTTPAGVNPSTTTTTGTPRPSPKTPSLNNSGRPEGSSPKPGGPGTSRPGVPTTNTPGAGSPILGTRSTPGAGTGPMGPMAPGAGARRKDDESEHRAPDYLRQVHPDWAEGLDKTAAVIGEDPHDTGIGNSTETASTPYQYAPTAAPPPAPAEPRTPYYVDDSPSPAEPASPASTQPATASGPAPADAAPEPEQTIPPGESPMTAEQMADLLRLAGIHEDHLPPTGPTNDGPTEGQAETSR